MTKSTLKKVILVGLVCGNILSCGQVWADAVDISIDSPTSVTPTDYGGGYDVDNGVWGISGSQTIGLNVINSVATVAGGVAHTVHGIRVVDGYVINVGSLFGGIAVKANEEDMGALGIYVGEGEISIENVGSISATALDNGGCAFGIGNESWKDSVCSKSIITFVDEANIMVSAYNSAYGIYNSADKEETSNTPYFVTSYSNIGNMNVSAVDSAYGYQFFSDNTNSSAELTFAEGKIITVSCDGEAYGLHLEGLGTVDITKLGGIAAKAGGTEAAYGIYATNANDPAGSDVFLISFADAGGSISAYSATGENYGIKFDADSTGTSEVKNVNKITVGIDPTDSTIVSSGAAYGIEAMGGVNSVFFTGTDRSIAAKSSNSFAFGISYGDWNGDEPAAGTTMVTGLSSIIVESSADDAGAFGIYVRGQSSSDKLKVVFTGTNSYIHAYATGTNNNGDGIFVDDDSFVTIEGLGGIEVTGNQASAKIKLSSASMDLLNSTIAATGGVDTMALLL